MVKHKTLFVTMIVAMALLVPSALAAGGQAEDEVVEIEYYTHEDPNRTPLEQRLIDEFTEQNPDIEVTRVTHPSGEIDSTILTAFAADRGPTMFNLQNQDLTPFLEGGRLAPAPPEALGVNSTEEFVGRYMDGVLDPMMRDGELYGIPLELTNWAIFVNERIFRDAGLDPDTDMPTTWEEMMEVSDQIAIRDGDIVERRGFDFRYGDELRYVPTMVEQLGGQLVSDDGTEAIINDEAWLQVLEFFQEWGPDGRNLGSPGYTNARALFNFDDDEIAMTHTGQYQFARIQADNPEFYDSGEFRAIPFPRWENAVNDVASPYYGHYWVVNADASPAEQEAAWRLAAYFAEHAEEFWDQVAVIMPTHELLASEAYTDSLYADVFSEEFEKASIEYHDVAAPRIDDALQDAINDVMLEGIDPEEALETLRTEAQRALDEEF